MIVMIAVTSAMIVPSLDLTGASIEDESEKLTTTLRYAMEEAQFSGQPLRWVATKHGWYFEVLAQGKQGLDDALPNQGGSYDAFSPRYQWFAPDQAALADYRLPEPLLIQAVRQAVEVDLGVSVRQDEAQADDKPDMIGMVLFLPDGTTSQADIVLASEDKGVAPVVIEVRPGPAGIRIKKQE